MSVHWLGYLGTGLVILAYLPLITHLVREHRSVRGGSKLRKTPSELRGFLSAYDPRVVKLFVAVRKVVLEAAPQANELVYDAYNAVSVAYSYSERLAEAFCHIAAYERHVNLGFNRGAELPDPAAVLLGSGASIRHVRLGSNADLRSPPIRTLVSRAEAQGRALVSALPDEPKALIQPTSGKKRRPSAR